MNHSYDPRIERERLCTAAYYTAIYKYTSINITVKVPLEIREDFEPPVLARVNADRIRGVVED